LSSGKKCKEKKEYFITAFCPTLNKDIPVYSQKIEDKVLDPEISATSELQLISTRRWNLKTKGP